MTDAEARVWAELHRRVVASGQPVSREVVSKILDEMEDEQTDRHWRETQAAYWRRAGLTCLVLAALLCVGFFLLVTLT
jgi:hypothetical protein